ncbi:septum site-determining protein MinC [Shouchella lonarensis]|uniref:Probable septum site-determining protein MinC n=1 Tax=Shouchella lonarensis TaxID=1464122 RepID=A0A1G6GIJ6_9BACI|nr:septum site-determining protein MinC [Shouchella lonarensis]SDB81575.1 septum site-determining protein MinC [Shouchella lonarensis]
MSQTKTSVTIKGTKEGLIFLLDDRCSFEQLICELKEKLSVNYYQSDGDERGVSVSVDLGNRYLSKEDKALLEKVITEDRHLQVERFHTGVISLTEAKKMWEQQQTTTLTRMIRSGQVVHVEGNALLIGDVNPGGALVATGNIYVMGALKGKAHAGSTGQKNALIVASFLAPSFLQIAETWMTFADCPDDEIWMGAAFLEEKTSLLRITRIQRLLDLVPIDRESEYVAPV